MASNGSDSQVKNWLLAVSLLAKGNVFSLNGKAFLKTLILRHDTRISFIFNRYEQSKITSLQFLESLNSCVMDESESLFNELFSECSLLAAKDASRLERGERELPQASLTYGEVDYKSFYSILRRIPIRPDSVFYDLGSGSSRPVLAARISQDFLCCRGIEILTSLHNQGVAVLNKYNSTFRQHMYYRQGVSNNTDDVQLFEGSFLDFNWSDGDIVFANSTCYSKDLMDKISKKAEHLKEGTLIITFTKGLSNDHNCFSLIEKIRLKMSWGPATVYIHCRVDPLASIEQREASRASLVASLNAWKDYDMTSIDALCFPSHVQHSDHNAPATPPRNPSSTAPRTATNSNTSNLTPVGSSDPKVSDFVAGQFNNGIFHGQTTSPDVNSKAMTQIPYLLYNPPTLSRDEEVKRPLILYLHGTSSRGTDPSAILTTSLPQMVQCHVDQRLSCPSPSKDATDVLPLSVISAYVLCPLCPTGIEWKAESMCAIVMQLLQHVVNSTGSHPAVDPSRIYLTGVSMGGLGSWMLAARARKSSKSTIEFAALVPICGGGSTIYTPLVAHIPMWFFHGANDNVVSVNETDKMVKSLREFRQKEWLAKRRAFLTSRQKLGLDHLDPMGEQEEEFPQELDYSSIGTQDDYVEHHCQYTRYDVSNDPCPQAWMEGHNCWDKAYASHDLWMWVMSQRLPDPVSGTEV